MKRILVIIIILGAMSFSSDDETTKLYQQSLIFHLEKVKIDTVFILKCFDIELPTKIKNYTIVDISNNPKEFLIGKDDLYAVKIMPLEVSGGNMQVTLVDYILREGNGEVTMSNTGSEVFTYKYDTNSKRYKLIKKSKNSI